MTDPVRLLDGADDFERALLGSARHDAGSERALGKALAAVSSALATLGAASTASATVTALTIAKWLGAGALLGLVTTGGASLVQDHLLKPAASQHAARASAPLSSTPAAANGSSLAPEPTAAPLTPAPASEPSPEPEAAPAPRAAPTAGRPPDVAATSSAAASTDLTRELALLESARQSLNHGDAAAALGALARYRADFPRATFEPEARLLEIQAYAERGDSAAARRLAEQLLQAHPSGPYAVRARGLLESLPKP